MAKLKENISLFFNQLLNHHSQCELCLEPTDYTAFLCQSCHNDLITPIPACSQCSEPMPHLAITSPPARCGDCQQQPPAYDYSHCNYIYQHPITHWLHKMKDKHQFIWCHKLAKLMLKSPPTTLANIDALVFIPATRRRTLLRGFNAAEMITRDISQATRLPVIEQALIKVHSADQRNLNRQQRLRNMRNSLKPGGHDLAGLHILVVDDVMTTGATLNIAAQCLKSQGAAIVGAWTFARTPSRQHPLQGKSS